MTCPMVSIFPLVGRIHQSRPSCCDTPKEVRGGVVEQTFELRRAGSSVMKATYRVPFNLVCCLVRTLPVRDRIEEGFRPDRHVVIC